MNLTTATSIAYETKNKEDVEKALRLLRMYNDKNLLRQEVYAIINSELQKLLKESERDL